MDFLSERQNEILTLAREKGKVDVEDLSNKFGASSQTIQKDLKVHCDQQ